MSDNQIAVLNKRLRCFSAPDTQSEIEGVIGPGRFDILDYKKNFPDLDTDYMLLQVESVDDQESWICSRWKDDNYISIEINEHTNITESILDDDWAIDEQDLIKWLDAFRQFTYTRHGARYPYSFPGISTSSVAPPYINNCCTFIEGFIVKAWIEAISNFSWNNSRHGKLMILGDDLFSPITALVESGIATITAENEPPLPWTVIQGWRSEFRSGHTFIIVAYHPQTDRILTLESNKAHGLNGVGFRKFGNLRDFPKDQTPINWWENTKAPTWADIRRTYPERKLAALKIKNPDWAMPNE